MLSFNSKLQEGSLPVYVDVTFVTTTAWLLQALSFLASSDQVNHISSTPLLDQYINNRIHTYHTALHQPYESTENERLSPDRTQSQATHGINKS